MLALRLAQTGPGRADRGDVEAATNNPLQLRETSALTQCPAVLHRAEQRVVEACTVSPLLVGAAWTGYESMLRPSPAANAAAFDNGIFAAIGWRML